MDPRELSDQALLKHCLDSQDNACWYEFVRRFQPLIARVVARCLRRWMGHPDRSLVDDLVQDTFTKLCDRNNKALREFNFQHEHALQGFLRVVASRVAEDYIRQWKSAKRGGGRHEEDLEWVSLFFPDKGHNTAETQMLIDEIARCLAQRAADPNFSRDNTIFWLYYREGKTANEIAATPGIGLTVSGVESTLLRLTRYVREKLGLP